jgi:hypothetical protein
MIHRIFLLMKYQIWPLPTDPAELRELAIDFQVPYSHELEPALLQKSIHHRLKRFGDAIYIAFLLSPIFATIGLLVILFAWISSGMPL